MRKLVRNPKADGKIKTDKETAAELSLPLKTMKSHLRRRRKHMREQIEQQRAQTTSSRKARKTS